MGARTSREEAVEKPRYVHWKDLALVPGEEPNLPFLRLTNYIRTTKYTLWTFLPQNLLEQFMKKANFYFLIIAILSTTDFSPKTPLVSIVPLVFVLSVTAVKEAYEDYNRYKQDVETNNTLVLCYQDGQWVRKAWADVRVGDWLKILEGEAFPADMVLVQTSSHQGVCNIETSNLDGETNLKIKQAAPETYEIECDKDGEDFPEKVSFILESDPPNEKMDKSSWKGNILRLQGRSDKIPLGFNQFLLRGCTLRNTEWALVFVAFTGLETKLMQQNRGRKVKRSNIDKTVDRALYVIFSVQALWCVFGAVACSIWLHANADDYWFLPFVISNINLDEEAALATLTYLVLLDLLVPISLYVSMELVKFAQAWFINQDLEMYYEVYDQPARARTSNLNEELGQVEYIFSDKTGTLTRNMMEFLRCSIGGIMYGPGEEKKAGEHPPRVPPSQGQPPHDGTFRFDDNRLLNNLLNRHETAEMINQFLSSLAVCHTVIPEFPDGPDKVKYQAASPDELALVLAAKDANYYFNNREPIKIQFRGKEINGQRCCVNVLGRECEFHVLEILEFTSSRKRMSVVAMDPRDHTIRIICKGADNVIRERCSVESLRKYWKVTEKHLQDMAAEGLRTLVIAQRIIPPEEWDEWFEQHTLAKSSMDNRDAEINASSELLEKDFELLGATAIEDRLQDGVPETIAKLAQAGCKIWVLTGDKVETAINIGRSCNLLTARMHGESLMVVDIDESLEAKQAKAETLEALKNCAEFLKGKTEEQREHIAIVISGKALGFVFPIRKLDANKREIIPPAHILDQEHELQRKFLNICGACKSVLCCRMSPKQKSQVVKLVRQYTPAITLAIGDGANDVAMIESAHVGVGIEGLEGKQAVMSSDYAISQFRYLLRLMLVHGAWDYRRISALILYSFYKNVTLTMTQIWFTFFSAFSGQVWIDPWSGSLYNMVFTAFPILSAGIFNRDISVRNMIRYPELYKGGPRDESFNIPLLMCYIGQGFAHSLVLFFFAILTFGDAVTHSDGKDNDLWTGSTAMYTALVILANMKVALFTTTWLVITHVFIYGSVAMWWVWMAIYSGTTVFSNWLNPDMYYVFFRLCEQGTFWFFIILAPVTTMIPDFVWIFIKRTYFFTRQDIVQEREAGYKYGPDLALLPAAGLTSEESRTTGVPGPLSPSATTSEMARGWKKRADRVRGEHLGYVPFVEDETGDAFVMGQKEFLRRYMIRRQDSITNLDDDKKTAV